MSQHREPADSSFRVLGPFEVVSGGRVLEPSAAPKQRALLALLLIASQPAGLPRCDRRGTVGREPAGQPGGDGPEPRLPDPQAAVGCGRRGRRGRAAGPGARATCWRARSCNSTRSVSSASPPGGGSWRRPAPSTPRHGPSGTRVGLWRGPALDGLAELPFARLEAARSGGSPPARGGRAGRIGTGPRAGPSEALTLLEPHVAANPLREAAWGQLMLTLYRLGRQAEALRAYQELRRVLAEELGLEPNPALRDLEGQILAQSPELGRPAPPESTARAEPHVGAPSPPDADQPAHWPWSRPSGPPPGPAPPKWQTPPPGREGALTTIVFTDVEASTALRTERGDDVAQGMLRGTN